MTRAWRIVAYGPPDRAHRLDEIPDPEPGPDDVVIAVRAAAINPIDLKLAAGDLRRVQRLRFPAPAGFDCAGVIAACGSAVKDFAIGDEVFARADRNRRGAFAQRVAIQASAVALKPQRLDFGEAASLPLVALTTVQALVDRAQARPGQRMLVHAGSGGVGTFAVQYGKHLGLHVTTTTSSRNADWVAQLGADEVIAYDRESYLEQPARYDIVFDTLGGNTTVDSFRVVERGGTVVSIAGPPTTEIAQATGAGLLPRMVMWMMRRKVERAARERGARYFRFLTESRGDQLRDLVPLLQAGTLRPVIDSTFPFEDLHAAMAKVEAGRARGKVVIAVT